MLNLFNAPTFDPKAIPDLTGKVIIITGANGGLGYETLLHLAPHHPAKIYLCARTQAKYDAAMKEITAAIPDVATSSIIHFLELDLASFDSIRSAARAFLKENSRLDILINNAGIMAQPAALTKDGYEIQFGTNHLGHFLLTKLLLPLLRSTAAGGADVRIINLTSDGYRFAPRQKGLLLADDVCRTDMADYNTWTRYGQSKLANILFTNQLAKRYPEVTSVSVHPGAVATNLSNSLVEEHPVLGWVLWPFIRLVANTPTQGALNQTWAAVAPLKGKGKGSKGGTGTGWEVEMEQGGYYVPVAKAGARNKFARHEGLGEELWEWSEKEIGRQGF